MIQLTKSGNAIKFIFDDNDHYLYNGTIEVPVNSLTLVTDESGMFTFKKSATNDIFISGLYSEIGMTKAELETFYKNNMVGSTGGSGGTTPEEVQQMINESISGKQDTLVSGETIKTINGESVLGSGNISISSTGGISSAECQTLIDESISGLAESSAVTLEISEATSGKADADSLATVATSGSYDDLLNKPTIPTVPTSNSAFTNDAGYITSDALDGYATEQWVGEQGYITGVDLSNYATLQDIPDVSDYFDGAEYDTGTTRINFYHGNTVKAYIDASAFIVDGMIDDVRIETISGVSYLVIDFNTDSGKEDIQIPLTDIFDPSNYYTKAEVDSAISAATDDIATQTWVGEQGYLTEHQSLSAYSTTEEMNTAISGKADSSAVTAVNETLTTHTANTNIHVTSEEKSTWNAKSDFSGSYNDLTDKPTIPTVPTSNTAFTNDAGYITEDAISGKADSSAVTEEISAAVSGKVDTSTFETYSGSVETALSGKQDTLSAGTGIDITDNVISATGGGGGGMSSGEVQTMIDESISGKVDTSAITSSVTSASTDSEIPTAKAVFDAIPTGGTGGGTTYSAGRGIDITNDTISFSLPISAGTGTNALVIASDTHGISNKAKGDYSVCFNGGGFHPNYASGESSFAQGMDTSAYGGCSHAEGKSTSALTDYSHAEGNGTVAGNKTGAYYNWTTSCHAEGNYTKALGSASHAEGDHTVTNNFAEHASGRYNVSSSASTTLGGDSGNTLFSVGNGTADNARHNAFEIRQNGDIYIANTDDTTSANYYEKPMVRLQDTVSALGGLKLVKITAADYAQITPDDNTVYFVGDSTNGYTMKLGSANVN